MFDISISSDGRDAPDAFFGKIAAATGNRRRRIWIANHLFLRDPIALAGAALAKDPLIDVALMAMSPLTMHPAQLAMTAATLDEFYPGRITLCLGVGAPADLGSVGLAVDKPLGPVRESIRVIRALLAGEAVTFQGENFCINSRRQLNAPRAVPIMLAASGPKMLELAGSEADGVLLSAGTSVEFIRWCLQHVEAGAKGRKLRRISLVYGAVDEQAEAAHQRLRRVLSITLRGRHHARNLQMAGNALDQAALNEAVLAEDWPRAMAMITDKILAGHAASGTPAQVAQRFAAYAEAGLDEIVLSGVTDSRQLTSLINVAMPAAKGEI